MINKPTRWQCQKYIDWIKSQPCRVTMQDGVDPHHVINVLPGAIGSKVHDLFTIPLTREEHTRLHHMGGREWERQTGESQAKEVLMMINQALEEGLIEINWVGR